MQRVVKIRRSRQIQKNINNNMRFYQTSTIETGDVARNILNVILVLILAVSVAVTSLFSAINILFRVPDFYRFEFDRTEVYSKLDLGISGTDLGSFFSEFMFHSREFSLSTEFEGIERELFNEAEAAMMDNFRSLLDLFLVIAIVTLLIVLILIVIMQFNRMAKDLRRSLNIGLCIYIISTVGAIVFFNIYNGHIVLYKKMMEGEFGPDDLLKQMFEGRFVLDSSIAVVLISFIIMMIVRYIVWKITAQKGIFSEGLIGAGR